MRLSEFDKFGEFLHGSETKESLHSSKESLVRLEKGVKAILLESGELLSQSWIAKAQSEREGFWAKVSGKKSSLMESRSEILDALKSLLGTPNLNLGIQMHFRNKS